MRQLVHVLKAVRTRALLAWEALSGAVEDDGPALWVHEEAKVRREMRKGLARALQLSREIENLAYELIRATAGPSDPPELFQVHATLAVRVLQDVRVAGMAALNGYVLQSWTVAASGFEAANMMGFIANEPSRADRWLAHSDLTRSIAGVKDTIVGTLAFLGVGEDPQERDQIADAEYKLYGRLCLAKHINPIPERHRYWVPTGQGSTRLLFTPIVTPSRVRQGLLGLALANRAGVLAAWVYAKSHGADYPRLEPELLRLAERTVEALQTWNTEGR
jgi:hypothetical protein